MVKTTKQVGLWLILCVVPWLNVSADMMSVSVGDLSVPIMSSTNVNCSDVKSNRTNMIYIDDLSPTFTASESYNDTVNGHNDPNGVQDMVLVLALAKEHSNKINLLGVGSTNRDSHGHNNLLLRRMVGALLPNIQVWKEQEIASKIKAYARCPNSKPSNRLVVAMGGEWVKLSKALNMDTDTTNNNIKYRIFATALGGHNIASNPSYYDGVNPSSAKSNAVAKLGQCVTWWVGGSSASNSFRNVFSPFEGESTYDAADLDSWYQSNLKRHLAKIRDHNNSKLDSSIYESRLTAFGYNNWNSRLRVADFLSVAEWIWPRSEVHKKSYILPRLKTALDNL